MGKRNYITSELAVSYDFAGADSLAFPRVFGYTDNRNRSTASEVLRVMKGAGVRKVETFYYKVWLPFISNKKRILVLAIASYLALC